MAAEKIEFKKLEEWVANYEKNTTPRETKNVVISLDDINQLMDYCKTHPQSASISSVRFYLVRQNELGRDIIFNGQSQISLVGVPVLDYKDNEFDANGNLIAHKGGNDLKDGDDIFSIFPQSNNHEHSGLCPYNCRGSINNNSITLP